VGFIIGLNITISPLFNALTDTEVVFFAQLMATLTLRRLAQSSRLLACLNDSIRRLTGIVTRSQLSY